MPEVLDFLAFIGVYLFLIIGMGISSFVPKNQHRPLIQLLIIYASLKGLDLLVDRVHAEDVAEVFLSGFPVMVILYVVVELLWESIYRLLDSQKLADKLDHIWWNPGAFVVFPTALHLLLQLYIGSSEPALSWLIPLVLFYSFLLGVLQKLHGKIVKAWRVRKDGPLRSRAK